jgi:hypothetical protein
MVSPMILQQSMQRSAVVADVDRVVDQIQLPQRWSISLPGLT